MAPFALGNFADEILPKVSYSVRRIKDDPVVNVDRLHDHVDEMVAVFGKAFNVNRKIDLGVCID